jgi:hypothetical protein
MDLWADFASGGNAVQATVLKDVTGYISRYISGYRERETYPELRRYSLDIFQIFSGYTETGVILSHYLRLHL